MHRVVIGDGHVHLDQPLRGTEARRRGPSEPRPDNQQLGGRADSVWSLNLNEPIQVHLLTCEIGKF